MQSGEPAVSQLGSARYSIPRRKWRTYGQKNKSELRPTQSKYALQDTLPDSQNDFSVDDMHDVVSDVWHETCEGEHFSDLNASSDTLSDGWPEISCSSLDIEHGNVAENVAENEQSVVQVF